MHFFEVIVPLKKGNINPHTLVKGREPIQFHHIVSRTTIYAHLFFVNSVNFFDKINKLHMN